MKRSETKKLLERCTFPGSRTEVVCAVSGGADSLALLVLASEANLVVTAVHIDHGLRPDSAGEADVVAQACARFGAAFVAEKVTVASGTNLEERCRIARKEVLGGSAMTGHTADDQAETVLINLMRGAGLAGISAMEPGFEHPILGLRRFETHQLCERLNLNPVFDPSNDDPKFVRNRVRHELIPLVADISERDPVPLLNRSALHAREAESVIDDLASGIDVTDTRVLAKLPTALAHERLRRWLVDSNGRQPSSKDIEKTMQVVRHEAVAADISKGRRVVRTDGILRLEPQRSR